MTLVETLIERQEFWFVTALVVGSILQSFLGAKADWAERFRRRFYPKGHRVLNLLGRPLLREKGDSEYICTVEIAEEQLERVIDAKYHRNLFATLKYRLVSRKRDYEQGSWVHKKTPISPKQHHVYYFLNSDGTIDIYGHKEANITKPDAHTDGKQSDGDPDRVLRDALDAAGINYTVEEGQ